MFSAILGGVSSLFGGSKKKAVAPAPAVNTSKGGSPDKPDALPAGTMLMAAAGFGVIAMVALTRK